MIFWRMVKPADVILERSLNVYKIIHKFPHVLTVFVCFVCDTAFFIAASEFTQTCFISFYHIIVADVKAGVKNLTPYLMYKYHTIESDCKGSSNMQLCFDIIRIFSINCWNLNKL